MSRAPIMVFMTYFSWPVVCFLKTQGEDNQNVWSSNPATSPVSVSSSEILPSQFVSTRLQIPATWKVSLRHQEHKILPQEDNRIKTPESAEEVYFEALNRLSEKLACAWLLSGQTWPSGNHSPGRSTLTNWASWAASKHEQENLGMSMFIFHSGFKVDRLFRLCEKDFHWAFFTHSWNCTGDRCFKPYQESQGVRIRSPSQRQTPYDSVNGSCPLIHPMTWKVSTATCWSKESKSCWGVSSLVASTNWRWALAHGRMNDQFICQITRGCPRAPALLGSWNMEPFNLCSGFKVVEALLRLCRLSHFKTNRLRILSWNCLFDLGFDLLRWQPGISSMEKMLRWFARYNW